MLLGYALFFFFLFFSSSVPSHKQRQTNILTSTKNTSAHVHLRMHKVCTKKGKEEDTKEGLKDSNVNPLVYTLTLTSHRSPMKRGLHTTKKRSLALTHLSHYQMGECIHDDNTLCIISTCSSFFVGLCCCFSPTYRKHAIHKQTQAQTQGKVKERRKERKKSLQDRSSRRRVVFSNDFHLWRERLITAWFFFFTFRLEFPMLLAFMQQPILISS